MSNKATFDQVSIACSRKTTFRYSTSFSLGVRFLHRNFRDPIHAVYGFVRFADEIVDTFHDHDKRTLLEEFKRDTRNAIDRKISLNPILNSFQQVYHRYDFEPWLVDTFLKSMEMDLDHSEYDRAGYEEYILGSAEVVGLMCLKIFTEGDRDLYDRLKPYAMKLGSAFQKINFLRDLRDDSDALGRAYFPELREGRFTHETKEKIEADINRDFAVGLEGIMMLPKKARLGVYVAYVYYYRLFAKIQALPAERIMNERIRIHNSKKMALLVKSYLRHAMNVL
jgi:15-cis-phytoene synthase